MTVSQALGAHAAAQMSAATVSDQAQRMPVQDKGSRLPATPSFVVSWALKTTVIGRH